MQTKNKDLFIYVFILDKEINIKISKENIQYFQYANC